MRCRSARRLIQDWLNKELDQTQRSELETHLARCDHCRAELASCQKLQSLIAGWKSPEPHAPYWRGLETAVLSKLESQASPQAAPRWRRVVWAGVASTCTFVLGVGVGFVVFGGRAVAGDLPLDRPQGGSRVAALRPEVSPILRTGQVPQTANAGIAGIKPRPRATHPPRMRSRSASMSDRASRAITNSRQSASSTNGKGVTDRHSDSSAGMLAVYRLEAPSIGSINGPEDLYGQGDTTSLPEGMIVAPVARRMMTTLKYVVLTPETAEPGSVVPRIVKAEDTERSAFR